MFPLKDTLRSRSLPVVTWTIILVNILVFLYEASLSQSGLANLINAYGLVPARLSWNNPATLLPLFTHMFLHGGWFHVLSNMWVLFIFGDNVEDRMGKGPYLLFYLLGGLAAGTLQDLVDPASQIPAIGASGAIAAVLGAYFLFYPRARVLTFVPIFILPWLMEIPAVVFLGFWFISQFFSGVLALQTAGGIDMGGVAWWAHIGGFIFGLLLARFFATRPPPSSFDRLTLP